MRHHPYRNYRIISVLFWAFPYLLWQAFGHWSGFLAGVILALILTALLSGLFRVGNWNTASSAGRQSLQTAEPQPRYQQEDRKEAEPYQRGYRAEEERYRAGLQLYQAGAIQPQYEEMQVPYPQEARPPMEQ
ncbi:MAG: hypothetical protein H0U76_29760 [Ktedonobacteraceae bacterium]|nr:hypothetical protein [Ktedonobacteraceae bacterium]